MKQLGVLIAALSLSVLTALPAGAAAYQTDSGTRGFLLYNLISGGEFTIPSEAVRQNLSGSGFFLMRLRPDGAVESVTMKMSSGHAVIDQHIMRVLKTYRFKPGTKQPIQWLVGFIQPQTVIVKLNLVKENAPPSRPKKK
jgi:TonB family protein